MNEDQLRLPLDKQPASRAEYLKLWERLSPLQIKMIEKNGLCNHDLGDTFIYKTPYKRPKDVCPALLHVIDLYTWRATLGFPSWEPDDPTIYRLHCPSQTGTVWELRKIDADTKGISDATA